MTDDFDGSDVLDGAGDKIGTVERTYVDDSGSARLIAVKIGMLMAKHRLVPATDASQTSDGVQVPYSKQVIEDSPDVDPGDTLEGASLTEVQTYYQLAREEGASAGSQDDSGDDIGARSISPEAIAAIAETDQRNRPASDFPQAATDENTPAGFGEVRDLGDVIEIPIVEEVLVKKPIVREVLRVRKTHTSEQGTAAADLRRETFEVMPSDEGLVRDQDDDEGSGTG